MSSADGHTGNAGWRNNCHVQEAAGQCWIEKILLKGACLLLVSCIDCTALTREGDINPMIGTCLSGEFISTLSIWACGCVCVHKSEWVHKGSDLDVLKLAHADETFWWQWELRATNLAPKVAEQVSFPRLIEIKGKSFGSGLRCEKRKVTCWSFTSFCRQFYLA